MEKQQVFQIVRFLGKTPASSEITALLQNLIQNIIDILSPEVALPREFTRLPSAVEELSSLFSAIIKLVPKENKLVVMLDGLDELSQSSNAFDLAWLPLYLPLNVKVIVSVLDEGYNLIDTLKERGFPISNFVNVSGLISQLSIGLLKHWMTCNNRTLTSQQWKSVAVTLGRKTHRPLYLRLLLDELLKWHSYDKKYLRSPPRDVTTCIRKHFERLEELHGLVFVRHAFRLLAVSKHGLSEHELEDILSLNDDVRTEIEENCRIHACTAISIVLIQRDTCRPVSGYVNIPVYISEYLN